MAFSNWTSTNRELESERTVEQALDDLKYRIANIDVLAYPHGTIREIYEALRDIQQILTVRLP